MNPKTCTFQFNISFGIPFKHFHKVNCTLIILIAAEITESWNFNNSELYFKQCCFSLFIGSWNTSTKYCCIASFTELQQKKKRDSICRYKLVNLTRTSQCSKKMSLKKLVLHVVIRWKLTDERSMRKSQLECKKECFPASIEQQQNGSWWPSSLSAPWLVSFELVRKYGHD